MTELMECPLCGAEARYEYTTYLGAPWSRVGLDAMGITVICTGCGCTIPSGMDQAAVAERWNRRVQQ